MNPEAVERLTGDLAGLLRELTQAQDSLYEVIREKLGAMRRSDPTAMLATTQREHELLSHVSSLERRRMEVVSRLAEHLGMGTPGEPAAVSIGQLAGRLGPTMKELLLGLGQGLREKMLRVAEKNRTVEMVSREMLAHFKRMFEAMVMEDEPGLLYSPDGEKGKGGLARILDAVG